MSHSNSTHHDDAVVLKFNPENLVSEEDTAVFDDPLKDLLEEFDDLVDDLEPSKEETTFDLLENRLDDVKNEGIEEKAQFLHEIILRTKYYMNDLESYLSLKD